MKSESQIYDEASIAEFLMESAGWELLTKEIQRLKDGALGAVLAGEEHDKYREHIGFISALERVTAFPRELVERRNELG